MIDAQKEKKLILIFHDLGNIFREALEERGYQVSLGSDPHFAPSLARKLLPDVIITHCFWGSDALKDVSMMTAPTAGKSGSSIYREIRSNQETRQIKWLIVSASTDPKDFFPDADAYLAAPCSRTALCEAVDRLLA